MLAPLLSALIATQAPLVHALPATTLLTPWDGDAAGCSATSRCISTVSRPGGIVRFLALQPISGDNFPIYATEARNLVHGDLARRGIHPHTPEGRDWYDTISYTVNPTAEGGTERALKLGRAGIALGFGGLVYLLSRVVRDAFTGNFNRADIEPSNPGSGRRRSMDNWDSPADVAKRVYTPDGRHFLTPRDTTEGCVVFQECYVTAEINCFTGECDQATVEPWNDEDDITNQIAQSVFDLGSNIAYLESTVRYQTGSGEAGFNVRLNSYDDLS